MYRDTFAEVSGSGVGFTLLSEATNSGVFDPCHFDLLKEGCANSSGFAFWPAILRFAGAWAALILRLRPAGLRFGVFIKKALFRVL